MRPPRRTRVRLRQVSWLAGRGASSAFPGDSQWLRRGALSADSRGGGAGFSPTSLFSRRRGLRTPERAQSDPEARRKSMDSPWRGGEFLNSASSRSACVCGHAKDGLELLRRGLGRQPDGHLGEAPRQTAARGLRRYGARLVALGPRPQALSSGPSRGRESEHATFRSLQPPKLMGNRLETSERTAIMARGGSLEPPEPCSRRRLDDAPARNLSAAFRAGVGGQFRRFNPDSGGSGIPWSWKGAAGSVHHLRRWRRRGGFRLDQAARTEARAAAEFRRDQLSDVCSS